ncbi:sugar ABC transporter ATP-binding protein [Agrobacterium tumefaciens]|uniref:sugar ABC transporter ATP-binding protein n=1 Tax=Agrobacterium tumefaciens TaxID=358 RepID=UPI0012B9E1E1|nr:sugar ABC transporter ATP-binding protein [Agrobacterium tumefaciens]MQB07988.1 sugar ABC transporter ATP-binding protein [Agrobacterium tumefaciens]
MTQSLQIDGLSKAYPGVIAAHDVTFDIHPGEVVGVLGKNGAGKSTVMRILGGVERPDSGTVTIDGVVRHLHSASDALKSGIVTVHQELNDVPVLTVAENICLGLGFPKRNGLIDKAALLEKARWALEELHADISPSARVGDLTVAERRVVMIARALAANARFIILDEPTASLTETEIGDLFAVIRRLTDKGVGFLYVSHRLKEIFEICSRILVMRDGALVADIGADEASPDAVVSLIAGRSPEAAKAARRSIRMSGASMLGVSGIDPLRNGANLSFDIERGEILGLAGLAGSGRTEAIRQLVGADSNPNMRVEIERRPISIRSPGDAWRAGIGLVPEDRRNQGAILQFPVFSNITLSSLSANRALRFLPLPSLQSERTTAQDLIKRLSLKTSGPDEIVANLSGGSQQKAILARTLASRSRVLVLDEPTHGIDVDAKEEIYDLIRNLADAGTAIILISSELSELVRLADNLLVLRDGACVAKLENKSLTEEQLLHLCLHADGDHRDTI